jgi:hypothetical protein
VIFTSLTRPATTDSTLALMFGSTIGARRIASASDEAIAGRARWTPEQIAEREAKWTAAREAEKARRRYEDYIRGRPLRDP